MRMRVTDCSRQERRRSGERGFSVLEMLIVLVIVIAGATLAVMQVARSQREFQLANAEREFMSYLEKARVDSIRRRAKTLAQAASVTVTSTQPDRFSVTMDFAGNGNMSTRVIRLPRGVTFNVAADTTIAFDWRGRAAQDATLALTNGQSSPPAMRVRKSGDIMSAAQSYYNPPAVNVQINAGASVLTKTTNVNARTQLSTAAANAGY